MITLVFSVSAGAHVIVSGHRAHLAKKNILVVKDASDTFVHVLWFDTKLRQKVYASAKSNRGSLVCSGVCLHHD